ncbi:double-stranded rna-binding protein 3 [Quercus suber]|uniref:Double-stranded rna-binding protein 3 n=1 Tax=Quercus suber TaxID=58331 RepID=A0AAW0LGD0_QUESU
MFKNQLQELAQRSCFNLPSYSCIREGPDHAPRFKATVNFNGENFESPTFCSTLRQAEHAAAEVALNTLATRGPSRALAARVLDETGVYKNLLQETAHRAGLKLPLYTTVRSGPGHVPVFSCKVELAGMNFTVSQSRSSSTTSSSPSLECKGNEEQEQVIIARVLASLRPSEANKSTENYHRHGRQRSTPILWGSNPPTPTLYPMRCQNWAYSTFSPEMAMYQIWHQEQLLQQQHRLLALAVPAATPSAPQLYPFMQSMLRPDCCLYFPGRELESVPMGPKITIATSGPSLCFSNHLVPSSIRGRSTVTIQTIYAPARLLELESVPMGPKITIATSGPSLCFSNHLVPSSIRGRSTVTIQEIQEEKPEESSNYSPSGVPDPPCVGNISTEPQILETVQEDEKQNLGGLDRKISNLQLEGNQTGNSEWACHRGMVSGSKPIEFQLQNPRVDSSLSNVGPQYRYSVPPLSAAAPVRTRTVSPTSSLGFRPQNMASPWAAPPRMRTGVSSCSPRPPERFDLGVPPAFMAPAVRIRSVVPVCSAPPVRKMPNSSNEVASSNREKKDSEPEGMSRAGSKFGKLRI